MEIQFQPGIFDFVSLQVTGECSFIQPNQVDLRSHILLIRSSNVSASGGQFSGDTPASYCLKVYNRNNLNICDFFWLVCVQSCRFALVGKHARVFGGPCSSSELCQRSEPTARSSSTYALSLLAAASRTLLLKQFISWF